MTKEEFIKECKELHYTDEQINDFLTDEDTARFERHFGKEFDYSFFPLYDQWENNY